MPDIRNTTILTDRLELWLMTEPFLTDSLEAPPTATRHWDTHIPPDWHAETSYIRLRRDQYRTEPGFPEWGVRAIIKRDDRQMIGHIGFHTSPDPDYLRPHARHAVEFGFTIYPQYRRNGFATEAARALIDWAVREKQQRCFVLSASPQNAPSLAVIRKLGFHQIGSWIDPEDGLENVFRLDT